jgi:hypothetical protein
MDLGMAASERIALGRRRLEVAGPEPQVEAGA